MTKYIGIVSLVLSLSACSWIKQYREDDGLIRIGVSNLPDSFDPAYSNVDPKFEVLSWFYQRLYSVDATREVPQLKAELAQQLPVVSEDGKSFHFKIKSNQKFAASSFFKEESQRELDSEDVVRSLLRVAIKSDSDQVRFELDQIQGLKEWRTKSAIQRSQSLPSGIKILSKAEFSISLSSSNKNWIFVLAQPVYSVVPSQVGDQDSILNQEPLGSSGIILKAKTSLNEWTLERSSDQQKFVLVKGVVGQLQAGFNSKNLDLIEFYSNDFVLNVKSGQIDKYIKDHQLSLTSSVPYEFGFLALNDKSPVIKSEGAAVRAFVDAHLNREELVQYLAKFDGQATDSFFGVHKGSQNSTSPKPTLKPSRPLILFVPDIEAAKVFGAAVSAMLAKGGVQLEVRPGSQQEFISLKEAGKIDLYSLHFIQGTFDPSYYVSWIQQNSKFTKEQSTAISRDLSSYPEKTSVQQLDATFKQNSFLIPVASFKRIIVAHPWIKESSLSFSNLNLQDLKLDIFTRKAKK